MDDMATKDYILGTEPKVKVDNNPPVVTTSAITKVETPKTDPPTTSGATLSYVDMFRKLNPYTPPTQEELAKEKKKQKREQIFAAIGDGVSALANLYFTTQGAPNMYTGNNTSSERTKIRYDKLKKERDTNNTAYYNGMVRALLADDEKGRDVRSWKRTLGLDEQERQRYADNIYHRDRREGIADKRYADEAAYREKRDKIGDSWKKKEFDSREKQYEQQNALAWDNHKLAVQSAKDNKAIRQLQIKESTAKAARGKQIAFSDGKGKQVSVYENVWKDNMQQVFDSMVADNVGKNDTYESIYKRRMGKMTAKEKDDFVKQNWHKSPKASQLMYALSKLDPAAMTSEVGSSSEELGWGNSDNSGNNETDW